MRTHGTVPGGELSVIEEDQRDEMSTASTTELERAIFGRWSDAGDDSGWGKGTQSEFDDVAASWAQSANATPWSADHPESRAASVDRHVHKSTEEPEPRVLDAAVGLQSSGHKVTILTSYRDTNHCFDEARDGRSSGIST